MRLLLTGLLFLSAVSLLGCGGDRASSTPEAAPAPAATPAQTLPKIVAFGDSLTAGYGLNPKQSYPALLQQKLDADGYKYEVVNAGVSGDTSAGGLRRLDWSLEGGDVRFLILELGANDFLRGQPVKETRRNLSQIIERAKSRGVRVLLAGMYTTTNSGDVYLGEIDETFKSLASEHDVPLIPFFLENVAGKRELNLDDGVHPNAEGTKIVADTVYKYLKPLLDAEGGGKG
ncbi:MAG TPA: arylesterase [Pyrinomonadaceae bacterium]|nr:arylesterase [Pyrinomonadaceae bacterium]